MNNYHPAENIEKRELSEEEELGLLLTYLGSHNKIYIQDFLKERGLPYSYRKSELANKLIEHLENDIISLSDLVALLDNIEGWGRQQIYLYNAPGALSARWRDPGYVRRKLADTGCPDLLNQSRPLILPAEPTLSTIEFNNNRIRFIWVNRRTWYVPVSERDLPELDNTRLLGNPQDQLVWRPYRLKMARGLIVFEWNLNTNDAMMLIQQLPSGRKYNPIRDEFEGYLRAFFDIDSFEKIRVSSALLGIEASGETRRHHMTYRSMVNRGTMAVTSPRRENDVLDADLAIKRARDALGVDGAGLLGNFYWTPRAGRPSKELYTQLYGEEEDDQRVGILAEHTEENVRYVLSRIRHHCV